MRKKASPQRYAKNNKALKATKPAARPARPAKPTTGKGLGKGGAKRLGRLLKRAIQDKELPVRAKGCLQPKTPVRLLKHQIKTAAENAPKAQQNSPHVPQLIHAVVSQYKHRGGFSMAELRQTLAAGGYDVTKTNRQKNVVTQRPVNNETLVRPTKNAVLRLNNKKQTGVVQVRTSSMKSPYSTADLRHKITAIRSSKRVEMSLRQARKTPKPKGKTHKPTAKPKGKTRKAAAEPTTKLAGKRRKASAKSYKQKKTLQARRKSQTPAGKKHRYGTNQAAQVQKAPKSWRRRSKQNRRP